MTFSIPEIGDPAPWFSAAAGKDPRLVAFDEFAGRVILLFFFGAATRPGMATALSSLDPEGEMFDGVRSLFVGISNEADDFAQLRLPGRTGQVFLLDANGTCAARYGLAAAPGRDFRPTAFLLSPALQVLQVIEFDESANFIARSAAALHDILSKAPREHDPPLLVVPHVFEPDFCRRLIGHYEATGGREVGAIEHEGKIIERFDQNVRRRLNHYLTDEAALAQCRARISRRLLPMVYRAFQFQATRIERYLIGCYDAETGGYFRPHRDNTAPIVAHRRFAVSIILNEDFEGGALRFPEYNSKQYGAETGVAFVFSCSVLHEVAPVKRGRRYAFITFLYDEASHRAREEYLRSMRDAAGDARS